MKLQNQETDSLQDAFKKFRKKRMAQIKLTNKMVDKESEKREDPSRINFLREKFVNQALKYLGVPYARKYHEKGSAEYNAPLFLDCCALVRRVLLDMKTDLGFMIGRWNQAYQFDTLPITIEREEDLKPGDLVFITGVYFNQNKKKQKHNMVHVEIWLGDGEKTIGARYHKGRVQIHDSYKFVSKSYHSMVYHFKSIDTWLAGVCKSFCLEHSWKRSKQISHGEKSIFSHGHESENESAEDEDAEDDVDSQNDGNDADDNGSLFQANGSSLGSSNSLIVASDSCSEANGSSPATNGSSLGGNGLCFGDNGSEVIYEGVTIHDGPQEIPLDNEHDMMSQELSDDIECSSIDSARNCIDQCVCCCSTCQESVDLKVNAVEDDFFRSHGANKRENGDFNASDKMKNCSPDSKKTTCFREKQQRRQRNQTNPKSSSNNSQRRSRSKSPSKSPCKVTTATASFGKQGTSAPKFYIGGHNGVALVEKPLLERGWQRITDNNDLSYYLKWVECKSQIDYKNFRESEQLVNHIPNGSCLTSKYGLMRSLQAYERINNRTTVRSSSKFNLRDFYPETYSLESKKDFDDFNLIYQAGETWICKPNGANQGKGIFLIKNLDQLKTELDQRATRNNRRSAGRIISRYIMNPLLLDGYKFDIRAYMLIASTKPFIVLYHPGYVRLSCVKFSNDSTDVATHLTNQYVQKKHPDYSGKKNDTVWTFERLNRYIDDNYKDAKGLKENWVNTDFTYRIKEIMLSCFRAVEHTIEKRIGFFDLLGFDFMIDENMKVWLIEVNVNPALFTNCDALQKVIPDVVDETLNISIEAFENRLAKKKVNPLTSVKNFQLLHDGERNFNFVRPKVRKMSQDQTDKKRVELDEQEMSKLEDEGLLADTE